MLDNHDSYNSLLNISHKERLSLFILPVMIIITIVLMCFIQSYDVSSFLYVYEKRFIVTVPVEDSDYVINGDFVTVENHKYEYEISNISSVMNDGMTNYQNITININGIKEPINNQVGTISFYYNKEPIIKKILKVFFWKG